MKNKKKKNINRKYKENIIENTKKNIQKYSLKPVFSNNSVREKYPIGLKMNMSYLGWFFFRAYLPRAARSNFT